LIKAVFGQTVLSDIHTSMNNIDKLRNIIMREQKLLHPYGQGIMGVVHAYNQNESDIRDYIQKISKYLNLKVFRLI
jgi:Mg2+ and Co2+ transporter CorA